MFNQSDVCQLVSCVKWSVADADAEIIAYCEKIRAFVAGLAIDKLTCFPETISIGGMVFGKAKVEAVITELEGSGMYSASFGLAYGPRSVWLATLRCSSGFLAKGDDAYQQARAASRANVRKMAEFDFMDCTLQAMHEHAIS